MSGSRVIRATPGGWAGVEPRSYKDEDASFSGVARHTLLGARDGSDALDFEVRYFQVRPGGCSSLEHHAHAHAVVILEGRGRVRLGERLEPVRPFDVVYVAPHEVHRFEASEGEGLGFLCIVHRDRDRPVTVGEAPV